MGQKLGFSLSAGSRSTVQLGKSAANSLVIITEFNVAVSKFSNDRRTSHQYWKTVSSLQLRCTSREITLFIDHGMSRIRESLGLKSLKKKAVNRNKPSYNRNRHRNRHKFGSSKNHKV